MKNWLVSDPWSMTEQEISFVIEQFVNVLVGWQSGVNTAKDVEKTALEDVVFAAGFTNCKVVAGTLKGNYSSQENPIGETFTLNCLCPFFVVGVDGKDRFDATVWLDQLVARVRTIMAGLPDLDLVRQEAMGLTKREVKKCLPLKPILLTEDGENTLCECPREYHAEHARDSDKITVGQCVGVHGPRCWGQIVRLPRGGGTDVLLCKTCYLGVVIPARIDSYGDLRHHTASEERRAR